MVEPQWAGRLPASLLAFALIASELLACAAVARERAGAALLLHLLAALVALEMARAAGRPGWGLRAALGPSLLVLALPCAGAAILLGVLLPAWRERPRQLEAPILDLPAAGTSEPSPVRFSTPRAIREVLATSASLAERLQAVLGLRHLPAPRAVPILRLCFRDGSEDVRLLAFADLERRESKLRARLQQTRSALAAGGLTRRRRAQLEQRLAGEHWELVDGGFVSGALETRVLDEASCHAQAAFELGARGAAAVLLARLALRRGQAESVGRWLDEAAKAGVSQAVCAPLFAEAAYAERRFAEVGPRLARASRSQLRRPELDAVVDFWTNNRQAP